MTRVKSVESVRISDGIQNGEIKILEKHSSREIIRKLWWREKLMKKILDKIYHFNKLKSIENISDKAKRNRSFAALLQLYLKVKWKYKSKIDGIFWGKSKLALKLAFPSLEHKEHHRNKEYHNNVDKKYLIKRLNNRLKWKEHFKERYSRFVNKLETELGLPKWIITSLVWKESTYWQNLNSYSGSKWLIQLTAWPFADMMWKTKSRKIDKRKIKSYHKLFSKLNIDSLMNVDMWNWVKIWDSLPKRVISILKEINNPHLSWQKFRSDILKLKRYIKSNKRTYYHALNMILWAVYFKHLLIQSRWNIKKAATNYNWDNKVYRKDVKRYWRRISHKHIYWRLVYNYWKKGKWK